MDEKSVPYPTQSHNANAVGPEPSNIPSEGVTPYPPPPPGYSATFNNPSPMNPDLLPPNPPNPTMQVNSATVVIGTNLQKRIFSRHPTQVVCQHCNSTVVTDTHTKIGGTTWLICGFCIIFGLWLGCCFIPFCVDACKDTYHDCPNCKKLIEVHKPM